MSGAGTVAGVAVAAGGVAVGSLVAAVLAAAMPSMAVPAGAAPGGFGARVRAPFAETARLLRQRRRVVVGADGLLRTLGCVLPVTMALLMALVVPFDGRPVLDTGLGVVWFNMADVLAWAGWWLIGWGGNSVYALVGGYRFLAQALAYELPLMFALTTAAVAARSVDAAGVVAAQRGDGWYVWQQPVAAVVFVAAVAAFATWGPFAHPVGLDAAGGAEAELSGMDRLLVHVGRYALLAVSAAMGAALFLAGPAGPVLPGWLWALVKTLAVLVLLLGLRRLPAIAAERAMRLSWVIVLPATLLQVLVTAVVTAGRG